MIRLPFRLPGKRRTCAGWGARTRARKHQYPFLSAEGSRAGRRSKRTKEKEKTALPARYHTAKKSSCAWPIPPSVGGVWPFVPCLPQCQTQPNPLQWAALQQKVGAPRFSLMKQVLLESRASALVFPTIDNRPLTTASRMETLHFKAFQ